MKIAHPLGTVAALWRYPVKSLRAEPLERAHVDEHGLEGDRRRALFLSTPDHARTGKTLRGKEHNLLHTVTEAQEASTLAAVRGLAVEERRAGPYFDDQPVSLVLDRWIAMAERLVGRSLDPLRWRPNVFVRAAAGFDADETSLVGARLCVGEVQLRVQSTIERCVTTTYDVQTGYSDPHLLRAVAQHRANVMGIYCTVDVAGTIAVGAAVEILG